MTTRRNVLAGTIACAAAAAWPQSHAAAASPAIAPATRPIPSSGVPIPLIGLGSWITFNVGEDRQLQDESASVIAAFFSAGGRLIDSSPMYGSSQATIGYALRKLGRPSSLFAVDKIWIAGGDNGPGQIEQSRAAWGIPRFDLLQVHNLLSWQDHLKTLLAMKAEGTVRYVGITTSEGRRHDELADVMAKHPLDFVQFSYNILDRDVEQRLLPLARDRGMAVLVNRPFRQGSLIHRMSGKPLPPWAAEIGATTWATFVLKFIISHPAVTCAIPATTRVDHVRENLAAATGILPDEPMRRRMADYAETI